MVESIANSVSDKLIDALSFKLPNTASYINERVSTQFYSNTGNVFEPVNGNRIIRVPITSADGWLDPSTVRLSFDIVNKDPELVGSTTSDTKCVRMLSGPHSFIRRARLLMGSTTAEDIQDYNRVAQMLSYLRSKHSRQNESASGAGIEWSDSKFQEVNLNLRRYDNGKPKNLAVDATTGAKVFDDPADATISSAYVAERGLTSVNYEGIKPGQTQRQIQKLIFGLFQQQKMLPLQYMPGGIVVEIELINDPADAVLFDGLADLTANALDSGGTEFCNSTFSQQNCSKNYSIQNVFIACDLVKLDNTLQNSYADHILSGKSLSINFNSYVSQLQTIQNQTMPSVTLTRALTRLKTVFLSFQKNGLQSALTNPGARPWRTFWSPMGPENFYASKDSDTGNNFRHNSDGEFMYQLQIGGNSYPSGTPMRTHAEAYMHTVKAVGIQSSDVHSFDISAKQYRSSRFIVAMDLERSLGSGFTGINTRAGDLINVKWTFASGDIKEGDPAVANTVFNDHFGIPPLLKAGARLADQMHIVLHSDCILEIGSAGCQIFD